MASNSSDKQLVGKGKVDRLQGADGENGRHLAGKAPCSVSLTQRAWSRPLSKRPAAPPAGRLATLYMGHTTDPRGGSLRDPVLGPTSLQS